MPTGLEWVETPVNAWMPGYEKWIAGISPAIQGVLEARRDEITTWMKANHPWHNRTRLAETTLNTEVVFDALSVSLMFNHGDSVWYSFYLEIITQGGRFGVLGPALDYWSPILLDDLKAAAS